jgi:flagellar hook-associated protein 2
MATSPVSSSSSAMTALTSADIQAANRASSQAILSSLNAGSGVDTASLAKNLVDAERVPRENAIKAKMSKNESKVSGLSAVMFMLSELRTKMGALKDRSSYNVLNVSNSNSAALGVTASTSAVVGAYDISVTTLAKPQRTVSTGFASGSEMLNGGVLTGVNLVLSSGTGSRPGVSSGTADAGVSSGITITAPAFSAVDPQPSDFTQFSIKLDGTSVTVPLSLSGNSLADLANEVQTRLRAADGGATDITVTTSGGDLVLASSTRYLSDPLLTADTGNGANAGSAATSASSSLGIAGVTFGTTATVNDFTDFSVQVGATTFNLTPSPATADLSALATDLQSKLRAADGNSSDLSVSVSSGKLMVASATREVRNPALTVATTRPGVSTGTASVTANTASINGVSFGSAASTADFRSFSVTIDGQAYNLAPAPATADLTALASDLQVQLRAMDGTEDLQVAASGSSLTISSVSGSRVITGPALSASATIRLDSGASEGTPTGSTITNVSFGTTPTVRDFKGFSINVGGESRTLIPTPSAPTLAALAADLQKQLRAVDQNADISVTVSGQTLSFASASGRTLLGPKLTKQTYSDTPQGVVDAINASRQGLSAQLVNDGSGTAGYKILVSGKTGASESFTLSSGVGGLSFSTPAGNTASDATLTVDGVSYQRKTNSISDIISGLAFDLKAPSNGTALVQLSRDTSAVKAKLKEIVTGYNDLREIVNETTNSKSELETYGATLVGDTTTRSVLQQMRTALFSTSSTPGTTIKSLGMMGFSLNEKGVLSLDEAKLDTVMNQNFDDVVKTMTGGYDNLSQYSKLSAGVAGDAFKRLNFLMSNTGPLVSKSENALKENEGYQASLEKLQRRMEALLTRYTKQFGVMEGMVGSINSQKTSLKSTFEGLMSMYTAK